MELSFITSTCAIIILFLRGIRQLLVPFNKFHSKH